MAVSRTAFDDPEDARAEQQAARAREEGTELIREHLRVHLSNNPSSSYVTWIATLHPENATVTIDPRFLIPGNPWKTVFNDTKDAFRAGENEDDNDGVVDGVLLVDTDQQHKTPPKFVGLLDGIMLFTMLVTVAGMTFCTELCALALRCLANLFQWPYELCKGYCFLKYTFGLPWRIMWKAVWFTEQVTLCTSVFVTELLAVFAWMLCTVFAFNCEIGRAAHQRTRRASHLIRWACRRPFVQGE